MLGYTNLIKLIRAQKGNVEFPTMKESFDRIVNRPQFNIVAKINDYWNGYYLNPVHSSTERVRLAG
jgi:hypothetical protein